MLLSYKWEVRLAINQVKDTLFYMKKPCANSKVWQFLFIRWICLSHLTRGFYSWQILVLGSKCKYLAFLNQISRRKREEFIHYHFPKDKSIIITTPWYAINTLQLNCWFSCKCDQNLTCLSHLLKYIISSSKCSFQ